jgi:PatG C-terminal
VSFATAEYGLALLAAVDAPFRKMCLTPASHRALYSYRLDVPSLAAEQFNANASLTAIDVLPSLLSGACKVVDVVFSFTDRATDVVSKFFTRVDVTECFPFLVTKMSPYYDR